VKPGQSGNPKGRPKDRKDSAALFEEVVYDLVPITENGRRRWMPLVQAFLRKRALCVRQGDPKADATYLNS
jgi:hypothetical protein